MSLIQTVSGSVTSGTLGGLGQVASYAGSQLVGAAGSAANMGIRAAEEALGIRFDAAPSYLFYVELSGVIVGLFTECSGLEIKRDAEPVKQGGVNDHIQYLPGRMEQSEITLKRGLSISRSLWDWFMQGRYEFNVKRINFSIIQGAPGFNLLTLAGIGDWQQHGAGFGKIKHWDIENAFPIKWELSELKTSDSETISVESLKIVHHGLSLSYEVGTPMSLAASVIP